VGDESGDEHPRPEVVGGVEVEPEDVVVLNVENSGDNLKQNPADQHQQRDPLEHLGQRTRRRPGEQPREHRPQLGQHHRNDHQSQTDMQTLGQPVQPRRPGGPIKTKQP
jgi:hypothetical protein